MKNLTLLSYLAFGCLIGYNLEAATDEFVTVEKRNVVHKFAKTGQEWVDGFTALQFKDWEEDTFDIFEMVGDKNGIAIDIGAWIGTTSIWLSKNFKHVVAIEADKESVTFLNKNLEASGCTNVTVCNKAISDTNGVVFFGPRAAISDTLNFSTSYAKEESNSKNDYAVASITFDQFIKNYVKNNDADHKITFIKCDIEGGEENILKDVLNFANENNCRVWMSFHYPWWNNKKMTDFKNELAHFYAICPKGDVCEYVDKEPFASVLLIPKRL